jgi:hypothetical protein
VLHSGERQVAPNLSGIRRDHLARYEWAARMLPQGSRVLDVACGVGYGAFILARAGHIVTAVDNDAEAIAYAGEHYDHPNITRVQCDATALSFPAGVEFDAAVCFETIEHLAEPMLLLRSLRAHVKVLLASVPNETHFPYKGYTFHHRHYTKAEFEALLGTAGFGVTAMLGQVGPDSGVEVCEGRTLVAVASAAKRGLSLVENVRPAPALAVPEHVVILGLGPSIHSYTDYVMRMGGRHRFADEVWAINALGDVIDCDRIFHMDQVEIQEIRAAAKPDSNIAVMIDWLKKHPGPIYTSIAKEGYPGLVELPIEAMINDLGFAYFNGTAAYAVAYAIFIGVKKISLFGIDFTLPNAHHAEQGRACVEFWLGIAAERGIALGFAERTSLMDSIHDPKDESELRLYGYDTVKVNVERVDGSAKLTFTPREVKPTAEEIEDRYDHSKHPSALVRQAQGAKR